MSISGVTDGHFLTVHILTVRYLGLCINFTKFFFIETLYEIFREI